MTADGSISTATQRRTLVTMILASGIVFLSSSIVNVALPVIERELGGALSGLQWIVDGYILALAALLIPAGSLGDRYGRRRMLLLGLGGFGVASLACGLAPTIRWLITLRILQGVTSALMVPQALAILRDVYTEPEARGRAIGAWTGWSGVATIIGPLLGGWLVGQLSWRWTFFINLPLVAATIGMLVAYVPTSRDETAAHSLDVLGALLVVAGLSGIAYGLIEGPVIGWSAPVVLTALIGGSSAMILFPLVEARVEHPMVPLDMFAQRNFSGANMVTLGVYFALQGTGFFLVLYVQNVMGFSPLMAGLTMVPNSLLMLALSPTMGKLASRWGARWFMSLGPLICGAGVLLLARLHPQASFWTGILPAVTVLGAGLSITVAPLTNTVISAVSEARAGVAAAFNNVASRVAGLLAIAGLGVVLTLTFRDALPRYTRGLSLSPAVEAELQRRSRNPTGRAEDDLPPEARRAFEDAFTAAFRRTMLITAAWAAAGGLIGALTIRETEDP
jgi:EmrB/QacA subfamily drug resistance transporter